MCFFLFVEAENPRMLLFHFCVLIFMVAAAESETPTCTETDYHFEYTQCDSQKQRWRVSVPKPDRTCTPDGPRPPAKGIECGFTCKAGTFLNIGSQKCEDCLPGTFSYGDTAKYEDWSKVPEGFTVSTQDISMDFVTYDTNCTEHGWTPKGSYIAVTPAGCSAYLRYSGTISKAGKVTFQYQLPDSYVIFHVSVQNEQCQKEEDSESNVWPDATVDGKWKDAEVSLNSGFNVITWKVIGLSFDDHEALPVMIKSVTIDGAAYTSECMKCPSGYYSSKGAGECTYCPENTYSEEGAATCTPCDKATQWSRMGAKKCETRPPCNTTDYYRLHTPCDEKKQTQVIYQWIEPQICQPNDPKSVHLPANEAPKACLPCNPGMELVNNTCQYCPKDYYSVGEKCEKCGPSTVPDKAYVFENWNVVPKELHETCISFASSSPVCHNDSKWLPMGDHIESHFARGETSYLVLQLKLDGFRTEGSKTDGEAVTVGRFKMVFETICESYCQLVLLSTERGYQEVVVTWEGSNSKRSYEYEIKVNKSMDLTIAFQNSAYMLENDEYKNAKAYIYSIEVTNTLQGGAKSCQKCPRGTKNQECVPCGPGMFIDPVNATCVMCPPGTVVYNGHSYGAESCKPCGRGLKPKNGNSCQTDGTFEDGEGRKYDFNNLTQSFHYVKGSPLFTSTGTQYYHSFNISLFGEKVTCANNVTKSNESAVKSTHDVEAMVCRLTMVPTSGDSSIVMATQSSSLGDRLVEIISNVTHLDNGTAQFYQKLYNASGFDSKGIDSDVQFHYNSSSPTRACPKGRKTIISLRCDIDEKGNGEIDTPPKCVDGTCDGCTFHFMWRSRIACPSCNATRDFTKVVGECVNRKQTIHYFPPAYCVVRDNSIKYEKVVDCTLKQLTALPFALQIAVPAVVALAVILCCLLCHTWRKNKKLEYKYMKLVEGGEGKDGELPGVDSCALEEGDDEQGDVMIKDSKGARFFKKLKNKMKKDDDAFDTTLMNERMPLT